MEAFFERLDGAKFFRWDAVEQRAFVWYGSNRIHILDSDGNECDTFCVENTLYTAEDAEKAIISHMHEHYQEAYERDRWNTDNLMYDVSTEYRM